MEKEIKDWMEGAQKIIDSYFNAYYSNLTSPKLVCSEGKRYYKIIAKDRAFGFIDKKTSNVLRPASWKSPAKTARGNLYDGYKGLGRVCETGVY